jgi:hypothetical protein
VVLVAAVPDADDVDDVALAWPFIVAEDDDVTHAQRVIPIDGVAPDTVVWG